ncbi:hypothetical protein [Conservatibacter flavescens]|uniref:Uncharacterized protein n=1 Tax=Conservatibacter flavescens TaxID=28161 RepID=A0A2M8S1T3_9PAST|nr:hypothetical protein [Conservatibacter flavescens]PJG85074.1 hypothetical protein CVP05_07395 [Conservatibacter flavescens]
MKKLCLIASVALLQMNIASASPVEYTLGGEWYKETYREYVQGNERFMQQRGNLWSFNGAVKYNFNQQHSLKLAGRYSKGKINYIGGVNGDEENPEGSPYGSVTQKGAPRNSFDIRLTYQYSMPVYQDISAFIEPGFGYRELNDHSTRIQHDDYDRKNKLFYAHLAVGMVIPFATNYEFTPRVAYNQLIRGKQYSYMESTIVNKQRNGKGVEVDLLVSARLPYDTKLTFGPFYRGWKVFDSNEAEEIFEPKNYTHEVGVKVTYTF